MKLFFKIVLALALMVVIYFLVILIALSCIFGKGYNTKDLIKNYEEHSEEIFELKEYIKRITPENFGVDVEYESKKQINLHVWEKSKNGDILWFSERDINPYNYRPKEKSEYELKYAGKTNSLQEITNKLDWQDDEFKGLKLKLDNANCISISKSESIYTIGFQRSGMGMYFYKIFENLSNDTVKEKYNDGCLHKYFRENIVLCYGGGAIGMQCFEDFYKDKEK